MRISSLILDGVGPFSGAHLTIPAPPESADERRGELVLFEGPNGSGKTTVAEIIAVAAGGRTGVLAGDESRFVRRFTGNAVSRATVQTTKDEDVSPVRVKDAPLELEYGKRALQLVNAVGAANEDNPRASAVQWAAFSFRRAEHVLAINDRSALAAPEEHGPLYGSLGFGRQLPAALFFGAVLDQFELTRIRALYYAQERRGQERKQARDLAKRMKDALRRIAFAMETLLERRIELEFSVEAGPVRFLINGEYLSMDLLGAGVVMTLAWLGDLLVRLERIPWADTLRSPFDQDFWLILDEIDESLHPRMQARFFATLRDLFPNAKIYATTHSPFAIAGAGGGVVLSIRPDLQGRVGGQVRAVPVAPGHSLSWVADVLFGVSTGIIDRVARELEVHRLDVMKVRAKSVHAQRFWRDFLRRRQRLLSLNEEVRAMVAFYEAPILQSVQRAQSRLRSAE